jgi:hypothetical protein
MKKIVFAIVLGTALLLASCVMEDSGAKFDPLPSGVYVAGVTENTDKQSSMLGKPCYWNGAERIDLEGYDTYAISASGGRVLVQGNSEMSFSSDGYWVDGEWHPSPFSDVSLAKAKFSGGKICLVPEGRSIVYIDGEAKDFPTAVADIVVSGGRVYTACFRTYFIDDTANDYGVFLRSGEYIKAMTVAEDGTVYIAAIDGTGTADAWWYGANGQKHFLEGSDFGHYYSTYFNTIVKITVSGGKVYVFDCRKVNLNSNNPYKFYVPDNCYWVDGEKIKVNLPESGFIVCDYALANGKLYMAGGYKDGDKYQACYWVDGQRHDLDGAVATAIYVEE